MSTSGTTFEIGEIPTEEASADPRRADHADPTDSGPSMIDDVLLVEDVSIDGMCGVY